MNKVMSQASDFLEKFQKELSTIPYALFTVSLTMKEPSVENIDLVSSWIESLKTVIQPEIIGYFAGVLDTESLPFVYRTIIRAMDEEDGDYRDWDAINTWAESLISIL
jgi:menaquinone-dependent protoporphyrinogen IX oxidase